MAGGNPLPIIRGEEVLYIKREMDIEIYFRYMSGRIEELKD